MWSMERAGEDDVYGPNGYSPSTRIASGVLALTQLYTPDNVFVLRIAVKPFSDASLPLQV